MFLEFLQIYLPIVIYILLIVALVIAIIIGLKFSKLLDKVDHVADSVSDKVDSLNGIFRVIDYATDKVNDFTTKAVDTIVGGISRFIHRKSRKKEEEEDL